MLFGGYAVIIDQKSKHGRWKETLPEIAGKINIVKLINSEENWSIHPYVITKDMHDGKSLAMDILTFLTCIQYRDVKNSSSS